MGLLFEAIQPELGDDLVGAAEGSPPTAHTAHGRIRGILNQTCDGCSKSQLPRNNAASCRIFGITRILPKYSAAVPLSWPSFRGVSKETLDWDVLSGLPQANSRYASCAKGQNSRLKKQCFFQTITSFSVSRKNNCFGLSVHYCTVFRYVKVNREIEFFKKE